MYSKQRFRAQDVVVNAEDVQSYPKFFPLSSILLKTRLCALLQPILQAPVLPCVCVREKAVFECQLPVRLAPFVRLLQFPEMMWHFSKTFLPLPGLRPQAHLKIFVQRSCF